MSTVASADGFFDTWFRFLIKQTFEDAPKGQKNYLWYKFNIFTRWISNTNRSIIVVFDPRPAVKERLPSPLLGSLDLLDVRDPYWIHALFAEEVLRLQDEAVWSVRNLVRKTEIQRTTSTAPNPDYPRLHDIARHAIHVSETLDLSVKTVKCMMTHHDQFFADGSTPDDRTKKAQRKIQKRLHLYDNLMSSLWSRSASNKERLLNEIQLAFNTVAQYDSRIGVEIGRAAQVDGSAMKTIAFLTLTFFPATFISAVFSMSFFNYNPETDEWTMSKKFWVYWAVAIPVTCITGLLWSFWHRFFPPKKIGEEDLEPRSKGVNLAKREIMEMATKLRAKDGEGHIKEKV